MHHTDLILTLTGGLAAALALGYLTNRAGLSPIVGYLLAGIVVGPHTPGFVANQEIAEQLAEVGVILLMFGVGLHFHPHDLLAVRKVAIPGALGQSAFATALGGLLGHAFGWDWTASIVFGMALSVASTVVLLRVLSDRNDLHTRAGHIAVGWLVAEDLLTVLVLLLLPALGGTEEHTLTAFLISLGITLLKLLLLALFTLLAGRVVPWVLERISRSGSRELFTLSILVLALGIAVASARFFGVSAALGAFVAGMIVGRSEFSLRAASEALPMRDAFAVLFFVSVGMLFSPSSLTQTPGLLAATCAVVVVGKPLAALAIVLLLRYPLRTALIVGASLAQIGEFSFILATLARELEILSAEALNTLVAASIFSITLSPLMYRLALPVENWLMRQPRVASWLARLSRRAAGPAPHHSPEVDGEPAHRAVIVGYGPVGQTITRLMRENRIEPTVIELNLETVRRLRNDGINAVYGDAGQAQALSGAGVASAQTLILSASGVEHCEETIRLARGINPSIRVLARSDYVKEVGALRKAGAERVFSGEGEVALALIEEVLRGLGATSEQIDRERERFRTEVLHRDGSP